MISIKIGAVNNMIRITRNFLGFFLKISIVPLVLISFPAIFPVPDMSLTSTFLGMVLILIGALGMVHADLMILRFGGGDLHLTTQCRRLVDVGFFARTRHPFFWFYSIYQYGILLFMLGFHPLLLLLSMVSSVIFLLWLIQVQEKFLHKHLGERYLQYRSTTPAWYWKLKIEENLKVGFWPQLIWFFGMVGVRFWYRLKVEGQENIPHDRPFIIVANHECYLDPFLFGIFIPYEIKFVTTADVFTTPLMRFLLKGTGSFPMRRHRQDLKSIRTMIRMVNKGQIVCIFPEGGRSTYGAPLPILKETLKLIQKCRVPILPVHLDGAYEIWPRWAPNRRHGRVKTVIGPIIPVEAQTDLVELEKHISGGIFAESKQFRAVNSRSITRGMDNLLWACYKCRTRNAIKVKNGHSIHCESCHSEWQVSNDYRYTDVTASKTLDSIEWIQSIESDILGYPLSNDLGIELAENEVIHLSTPLTRYDNEEGVSKEGDLRLLLSSERLILAKAGAEATSWSFDVITIFTMDYYNAVSIGVGGLRHTFKLPADEISLKWQTYFDRLQKNFLESNSARENPTRRQL